MFGIELLCEQCALTDEKNVAQSKTRNFVAIEYWLGFRLSQFPQIVSQSLGAGAFLEQIHKMMSIRQELGHKPLFPSHDDRFATRCGDARTSEQNRALGVP